MEKLKTVILGASGYTGAEAVRLILNHPKLALTALTANRFAGQAYGQVYPHMAHQNLPDLVKWQDVGWDGVDVVFACLPHGASEATIAEIARPGLTIIDLSADFRLQDAQIYAKTYGRAHTSPELLSGAVYGLTEYARSELPGASLVACPGCYPTASLLGLLPALDLIDVDNIVIDAKSGVSGAGRKQNLGFMYPEAAEGAHAYGVGSHRHGPEIDERIGAVLGRKPTVSFTPHLLPMNRGMIATINVGLNENVSVKDLRASFERRYQDEAFVHMEPEDIVPHTRHVRASNQCRIGVFADRNPRRAVIISVIDNLTKGSSGQAVQNLNAVMGWEETLGLGMVPVFP